MKKLFKELDKWSDVYQFSFQFWGEDKNSIYLWKNDIVIFDTGGLEKSKDAVHAVLNWIYKVNKTPLSDRINLKT